MSKEYDLTALARGTAFFGWHGVVLGVLIVLAQVIGLPAHLMVGSIFLLAPVGFFGGLYLAHTHFFTDREWTLHWPDSGRLWLDTSRTSTEPATVASVPASVPAQDPEYTSCERCESEIGMGHEGFICYGHDGTRETHFCPDCSKVGLLFMMNYGKCFDSTEDHYDA